MERSNQQTTDNPSSTRATAMRAGVQNPSGFNYQVAGPTVGGTATPYNPDNIEVAKEHLADSLGRASLDDNTTTTTTTTTGTTTTYGTDSTLKDQVISGASIAAHTAADVTMTVAAGAAAAGAATVSAVKHLFAGDKTAVDHSNPASTTAHTGMGATNKSQPIADFPNTQVHNMHDDSTPETPTRIHTHAATGPIHSVPVDFEPIHSTGLDSTASMADYRAKKDDLHATPGVRDSKVDVHPTTESNQGYNTHHSTTAIDARPSASAIDARPTTASTTTTDSRPLTEKVTAPIVGAAAAMGTAAAGTAAYLGNKASEAKESVKGTANNLTTPSASSATPSSESSHATMDSSKGYYNPSVPSSTSASATTPIQPQSARSTAPIQTQSPYYNTTTSSDSRPLTEKVTAPIVGAAAAMGTAAAGTAAYLGNKASEAKESVKGTANNLTTPSASSATPSSESSHATMDSSKGYYNPSVSSSTSYTSPASATTPIQPQSAHPTAPIQSQSPYYNTTTSTDSRPLTEKVKAPVVGAAAAMGATAAGTGAYHGSKASEAKESVKGTSNNNNTYSTPTPMNTSTAKTPAYTTASDSTPAAAFADPMIQTRTSATNPVTKAEEIKASPVTPVTEPAITRSPTLGPYQTKATTTNPSSSLDSPNVTTSSSRPMTEKISAPVLGAALLGTAAHLGNKATATNANNSTKMSTPSANNSRTTASYNPTNTSSYNTPNTAPTSYSTSSNTAPTSYTTPSNTAPTSYTTSSNTTIPAYEKSATAAAPIMAAASVPYMSNTSGNTTAPYSSATPNERKSADTTAAAIPASYHGSIPQAGPGEEVVWVKTVTTTDYYDDGTPKGRADVVDRHQEAIDPRAYATVKDGEKVYDNNDQHMHQQEHKDQDGAGRHL
ncbi:hypothetical protein KI688_005663 [Linnemannia hyalina]|uniref:Uncharacterized protein n=1 Tax=Linnemannia hyalina TaxID=64524 RepID=A0A9P7Y296_9FUNG|nr:hypothetical protein KI688_005663 [Linnemannia hyalina]